MMSGIFSIFLLFLINLTSIFADFCMKSIFLHSVQPLNPSSKLFCIVHENAGSSKITPIRTISHFRKYVPSRNVIISSPKEEIVEVWDDDKVTPFEYPATIFSDQCTGTAPLPLSKNISIICLPQWNMFDEKHCIGLKYLNVSYYLRKYSMEKNGNRTIVSMESIPEKNHLIHWLYWNGTACNNAVSSVLIKFIMHDGLLEDIAVNVHYANITKWNYSQQFYRFEAIFIGNSSPSNAIGIVKPAGYDIGQIIRTDSISDNTTFLIPYGMDCDNRKQHISVRFGIQINTACRLRITTCAQLSAQIQRLLDELNSVIIYSLPYDKNETITVRNDRLSFSKMKEMDENCELTTALSIQFEYVRFGNILAYSHRLISYKIELNKPDIIDLTTYPYRYIYFNFIVYFVDETAAPIQLFAKTPTINLALPPDFFYPFFTGTLV